jgi:hypothetical protein
VNHEYDDELLERAREDIRAQAAALHARPLLPRAEAAPSTSQVAAGDSRIDRTRLAYRIGELTDAHHRAFVEGAFRALLKRVPERREADAMLARLAGGAYKVELLGDLRWSPEGRAVGTRVAGLVPRYALAKAGRMPLLGAIVETLRALAGLAAQSRHQRASETYFAARDEAVQDALRAIDARLVRLDDLLAAVRAEGAALAGRLDGLHAFAHELALARDALIRSVGETELALRTRIEYLEAADIGQQQRIDVLNHWTRALSASFAEVEDAAIARGADIARRAGAVALAGVGDDPLRADRVHLLVDAFSGALPPRARALALAAGGDWVAALVARGIEVVGVEPDPLLGEVLRAAGATVEATDVADLFARSADASVDGIAIAAVSGIAGSMPLVDLLDEARRVLVTGGVLLLSDGREAAALLEALAGRANPAAIATLSREMLLAAGFADARRIETADGSTSWLLRRAGA